MMKEDKIHPTEMTTEEVLKFLISAGLFVPKDKHVTDEKAPS